MTKTGAMLLYLVRWSEFRFVQGRWRLSSVKHKQSNSRATPLISGWRSVLSRGWRVDSYGRSQFA